MAIPQQPPSNPNPTLAAALPATTTTRTRRLPSSSTSAVVVLVAGLLSVINLGLAARRSRSRMELASVAFPQLNLLLLFWSLRRFEASPPGSAARGRARLAVWLLAATLTAAFTLKVGAVLPKGLAVAAWVAAAATIGGGFCLVFARDE